MIITKEKYKDGYIVYIDETTGNIDDLPAHAGFECLHTALERWDYALRRQMLGERRADLL